MYVFNVVFALTEKLNRKSVHSAIWSEGLLKWKQEKENEKQGAILYATLYDDMGTKVDSFVLNNLETFTLQSQLQSRRYSIIIESAQNALAQHFINNMKPLSNTTTKTKIHPSSSTQVDFLKKKTQTITPSFQKLNSVIHESSPSISTSAVPKVTMKHKNTPVELKCLQIFVLMYTDQKIKKSKTWNDGIGKWFENGKWILYDTNEKYIDR
ncbi:hypothetical protein HMI55_001500 [Coelomomyces lativittatus]|nr:hypothetical protein HMI55_001500 [Coelomomyces lativittatus]